MDTATEHGGSIDTPAPDDAGKVELGPCRVCGRAVGATAWLCDREGLPTCEECQPKTPCGREEHGEHCPTHVFSDQPSAKHEAEHRYPLVGGYKSYMLAAQQAFVAGAEWNAALSRPAQPAAPDPSADGGGGGDVERAQVAILNTLCAFDGRTVSQALLDAGVSHPGVTCADAARAALASRAPTPPTRGDAQAEVAFSAEPKGQESIMGFSGFGIAQAAEEPSAEPQAAAPVTGDRETAGVEEIARRDRELRRTIARLSHYGDDGYSEPADPDDHRKALARLIARARDISAEDRPAPPSGGGDHTPDPANRQVGGEALRKALVDLLREARSVGQHLVYNAPTQGVSAAMDRAEAALATVAPPATPASEPVAWVIVADDGSLGHLWRGPACPTFRPAEGEYAPLYTAPQPATPALEAGGEEALSEDVKAGIMHEDDRVQRAACIVAIVERWPYWIDSMGLVTIRAHAHTLMEDLTTLTPPRGPDAGPAGEDQSVGVALDAREEGR